MYISFQALAETNKSAAIAFIVNIAAKISRATRATKLGGDGEGSASNCVFQILLTFRDPMDLVIRFLSFP